MTQLDAPTPERWTFFLGTHEVGWLQRGVGPLFVSHRRLKRRAGLPRAVAPWALDSGGFTELRLHGAWLVSVEEYIEATRRYTQEIGLLQFAFSMDWMCEPAILRRTGLTMKEHQRRTVANFAELRRRAPDLPFAPVLQGWRLADYARCADLYRAWGFDLAREPRVGVGSICTRQGTPEVERILYALAADGLALHAFGVKYHGLPGCAGALASADSTAWSLQARYDTPLPACRHQRCSNCIEYAVRWRDRLLSQLDTDPPGTSLVGAGTRIQAGQWPADEGCQFTPTRRRARHE